MQKKITLTLQQKNNKRMRKYNLRKMVCSLAAAAVMVTLHAADIPRTGSPYSVIPRPAQIVSAQGTYIYPERDAKVYVQGASSNALTTYLGHCALQALPVARRSKAHIIVRITGKKTAAPEGYSLTVSPKHIEISAATEAGAFYAVQTLLQLTAQGSSRKIDCCTVTDSPRFPYRGLHFDVSRHFRSKEFLIKQIDAMALLKLNHMHLHLTDAAGWRLAIERYPKLTSLAAWRPERAWQDWNAAGGRYCTQDTPGAYGGYYTRQDIRDILAYAEARHITVIPEIEMPGHSEEVLAAYPEVSCDGLGKGSDFCPGKEATFRFLEDVLTEVIGLFPSHYIHIGGDEAGKTAWKNCPDCKHRMQEEGLQDVDELQSYLIRRVERFVNSKGRDIIGWDEILQGGLAPNATVMSWRGTEGGIKAIKAGHDVVMTPGAFYYLDHTQDAPFKEPLSIGGYCSLQTTYDYDPVDSCLTTEEQAHLIGVQGNLWTEYVTADDHAEYMYYPRAFAVAETGWSRAEDKNYANFRPRAVTLCGLLQQQGYHTFDLAGEYGDRRESLASVNHLARGCEVTYHKPFSTSWPASGATTLTDGVLGGWTYSDLKWQGLLNDLDVTIDLGCTKSIHYVGATFMHLPGPGVFTPKMVEVELSADGEHFTRMGQAWGDIADSVNDLLFKTYAVTCNMEARYVRMHAVKNKAFLFVDEIIVN